VHKVLERQLVQPKGLGKVLALVLLGGLLHEPNGALQHLVGHRGADAVMLGTTSE